MEVRIEHLCVDFDGRRALDDVSLVFPAGQTLALLGAAGCGKSALLHVLNRLAEEDRTFQHTGTIRIGDWDPYGADVAVEQVRRRVGTLSAKTQVFPLSILENLRFGLRIHGVPLVEHGTRVEEALRTVGLWEDVERRLDQPAHTLTETRQLLLCLARALVVRPKVLLLDEVTVGLDAVSTARVEDVIRGVVGSVTVVLATRSPQQAARLAAQTAFLSDGKVVEFGPTETLFTLPRENATQAYLARRFG